MLYGFANGSEMERKLFKFLQCYLVERLQWESGKEGVADSISFFCPLVFHFGFTLSFLFNFQLINPDILNPKHVSFLISLNMLAFCTLLCRCLNKSSSYPRTYWKSYPENIMEFVSAWLPFPLYDQLLVLTFPTASTLIPGCTSFMCFQIVFFALLFFFPGVFLSTYGVSKFCNSLLAFYNLLIKLKRWFFWK